MNMEKDQEKEDSDEGQRTQAKPPPMQPGCDGVGRARYWQRLAEGGEGGSSRSS
jgi:hypothetical protein